MNKTAIITITQGDFNYIEEWVQYHHNLGIDLILIGYNGESNNFDKLPKYDYIRYIDFSYNKNNKLTNEFYRINKGFSGIDFYYPKHKLNFMCRCLCILLDYVKFFYQDIKYVVTIDIDEFVILPRYDNINVFLKENFDDRYSSMQMHSRIMTDNNLIYYEDKPCMERFPIFAKRELISRWISKYYNYKSIINVYHYNIQNDIQIISSPHNLSLAEKHIFKDSECYIKHFYTKSLEEYLMKMDCSVDNDYFTRFEDRLLYNYFQFNELTDEKLYAWNELCNKYKIPFDITKQINPSPFYRSIIRYCELFGYDLQVLTDRFKKTNIYYKKLIGN